MRAAAICLALAASGCSKPDPDWAKPCAEQRKPSAEVGTGATEYVPIGPMGVPIEVDTNGTYVWLAISVQGLGPTVTVNGRIQDATTLAELASVTGQAVGLTYDRPNDRDVADGIQLALVKPSSAVTLIGRNVTLVADIMGCGGRMAHGQASTQIESFDTATCQGCLDQSCAAELAACDADCTSIQACLDAHCVELSALASPDEAACQVYCQGLYPNGKDKHVALVSCVQASACQPPCNGYSIDYDECVATQNTSNACQGAYAPCSAASGPCPSYKACVSTCSTWAECQSCAAANPTGAMLYETYQSCVESTCLVLGWLPHQ
jgi:hypothetical protein